LEWASAVLGAFVFSAIRPFVLEKII